MIMPEDMDDNDINDEEFVGIVNSNDWSPEEEKTLRFKIVENLAFVGISVGVVALAAILVGGAVWVWQKVL